MELFIGRIYNGSPIKICRCEEERRDDEAISRLMRFACRGESTVYEEIASPSTRKDMDRVSFGFQFLPLEKRGQFPPADDQLLSLFAVPILLDGEMAFLAHASARVVAITAFQRFESCTE